MPQGSQADMSDTMLHLLSAAQQHMGLCKLSTFFQKPFGKQNTLFSWIKCHKQITIFRIYLILLFKVEPFNPVRVQRPSKNIMPPCMPKRAFYYRLDKAYSKCAINTLFWYILNKVFRGKKKTNKTDITVHKPGNMSLSSEVLTCLSSATSFELCNSKAKENFIFVFT